MNYKMKKMYGGTKKKMQAGGVDKTSERFKKASANTKSRNARLAEEKRLSKVKKSGKDVSYADRTKMKKGGAKPDYLDMDGDGNKKESMKSAVASKKKMKLGGTKEMKDLKKSQREARKELRKGQRGARKEQRGQDREERKDNRAKKKAGGMKKHQRGGFLEMPTFDLDRDSI